MCAQYSETAFLRTKYWEIMDLKSLGFQMGVVAIEDIM